MQQSFLYRPPTWHPRPRRIVPRTVAAALAGFDLHTASGFIFGDLAGALVSLAREASVSMTLRVYSASTGALVLESGTLTTDANGRLARFESASLTVGVQYHLVFIRASDGEVVAGRMTAT